MEVDPHYTIHSILCVSHTSAGGRHKQGFAHTLACSEIMPQAPRVHGSRSRRRGSTTTTVAAAALVLAACLGKGSGSMPSGYPGGGGVHPAQQTGYPEGPARGRPDQVGIAFRMKARSGSPVDSRCSCISSRPAQELSARTCHMHQLVRSVPRDFMSCEFYLQTCHPCLD